MAVNSNRLNPRVMGRKLLEKLMEIPKGLARRHNSPAISGWAQLASVATDNDVQIARRDQSSWGREQRRDRERNRRVDASDPALN